MARSTTTTPSTDHEPTHNGSCELEGTTAGALIPEIVWWGFQDLPEDGVSAAVGAQHHQRCLVGEAFPEETALMGLTATNKRMSQASSWRRAKRCAAWRSLCREHFLGNLLNHVPKAGQDMLAAGM